MTTYAAFVSHTIAGRGARGVEPILETFYCSLLVTHITLVSKRHRFYSNVSQTFSHHVPFVGPIMSPRTTFLQENSIYKISFDHKFGKPELTHRPMSGLPCRSPERQSWAFCLEPEIELKTRNRNSV